MSETQGQQEHRTELLKLTPDAAAELIAQRAIREAGTHGRRVVIGLAGGPGSGKSTMAAAIIGLINQKVDGGAARVPMDGFHIKHARLVQLDLADRKGAPETFEPLEFIKLLKSLKTAKIPISVPFYSRRLEDVVENGFSIAASVPILVVEGNYLLLDHPAWRGINDLMDIAFYIEVPKQVVRERLLQRHAEHGLFTKERNLEHVDNVDLANYDLVDAAKHRADVIISLITEV